MSFVERNKIWLLPVLGLGVAAVIWYNVRTFSGSSAEASISATVEPLPSPAPPPGLEPSSPVAPAPPPPQTEGGGLWDDLKAVAVAPAELNRLEALDNQARGVLPASALQEGGSEALRLAAPRVWRPREQVRPAKAGREAVLGPSAPEPDILIQLPEGRRVWFDGVGYRERQTVGQSPWRVRRIERRAVELQGPQGTAMKSIHPTPKEGS